MRILVAGATGAVGQPLVDYLIYYGHDVYGLTHSQERAQDLAGRGAKPLVFDIFDQKAVNEAFTKVLPEVVIDMLTSLPKVYSKEAMQRAAIEDAKLRKEGGANLQAAAELVGTSRYIVQSSAFFYEPGLNLAHEDTPFAFESTPNISAKSHLYQEIEHRVLQSAKIQGVALRFGFLYGPKTWFHSDGNMVDQVKNRQFPIIGDGSGVWSFVHVEDAAIAAASALYCTPGSYNIVNNDPSPLKKWLPAFARYYKAPTPKVLTLEEGLHQAGPDAVYYATQLRGASNNKARLELNFEPRSFEWIL